MSSNVLRGNIWNIWGKSQESWSFQWKVQMTEGKLFMSKTWELWIYFLKVWVNYCSSYYSRQFLFQIKRHWKVLSVNEANSLANFFSKEFFFSSIPRTFRIILITDCIILYKLRERNGPLNDLGQPNMTPSTVQGLCEISILILK